MRGPRVAVVAILVGACGLGGSASPSAAPTSSAPVQVIALNRAPANLGCDAMAVPYRRVTFRIDSAAEEQVTVITDGGDQLRTLWSDGFIGGSSEVPVVLDPGGRVVARDGDVLEIPDAAWPRLHGYFVCPSPDAIYVLERDPE